VVVAAAGGCGVAPAGACDEWPLSLQHWQYNMEHAVQ
jgi:hypothetical protein